MNEAVMQMLDRYAPRSLQDYENALKEILQELILLGLSRTGFFDKVAFYGGTAMRIYYTLDRFSEDLDFTLLRPDNQFRLDSYLSALGRELTAFGFDFTLQRVDKSDERLTESAFLKANTQMLFVQIKTPESVAKSIPANQKIRIKFEVDVESPGEFQTVLKTRFLPSPYTVRVMTLPGLFAGKLHAALVRNWKNRVKGRDFYDVQWYIARDIPVDLNYLESKLQASGHISESLTRQTLIDLFLHRVDAIDWQRARTDVLPFIRDPGQTALWSADFFRDLIQLLRVEQS